MEKESNLQNKNNWLINDFSEIIPELAEIYSFWNTLNYNYFKKEKLKE